MTLYLHEDVWSKLKNKIFSRVFVFYQLILILWYGNKCNIFIKSLYVELKPNFMKESLLTLLLTILTLDSCQLQLKDKTGIFKAEFSGFIE